VCAAYVWEDSTPGGFIPAHPLGNKFAAGFVLHKRADIWKRHLRETIRTLCFGKDSVDTKVRTFELIMWPHMRAAFNLARWLVRNDHDAEDIVQESFLKAYKAQHGFRGGEAKTWILSIVRNTVMDFLRRNQSATIVALGDPESGPSDGAPDPERVLLERSRREQVRTAILRLEPEFREAIVLREMEGMSYKEIAAVLNVPMGTVMSRLSRARNLLLMELAGAKLGGTKPGAAGDLQQRRGSA